MELIWQENNRYQYDGLTIIIRNIHTQQAQQGMFKFNEYFCDMEVNGRMFKDVRITFPITDMGDWNYGYAACVRLENGEPFYLQSFKEYKGEKQ